MKRVGNLWPGLISFANLVRALRRAARGKRSRPDVAAFLFDQERQLTRLACELQAGSYRPGPYRTFQILEPKPRLISAAPFRDRVVHHALCNILEPVFEKRFSADSFACRKNKGTHAAVDRFTHYARRHAYVFKGDIQKYFPSIDHGILKDALARKIKDKWVLNLASQIIDHSNLQEPTHALFTGDDLWTLTERRRGLPLGNQTSQFFANVFLDPFDHFVKETLRAPGYVRYVDDFVLFHGDKKWLAEARERCREHLAGLRLKLYSDKAVISRPADGTRFLG
jgi:RNA-directed DNA polymerase